MAMVLLLLPARPRAPGRPRARATRRAGGRPPRHSPWIGGWAKNKRRARARALEVTKRSAFGCVFVCARALLVCVCVVGVPKQVRVNVCV